MFKVNFKIEESLVCKNSRLLENLCNLLIEKKICTEGEMLNLVSNAGFKQTMPAK